MKISYKLKIIARAKKILTKQTHQNATSGQMIILFALMATVLFLFAGMAIDFGLMYLDKAKLSRAVDSLGVRLAGNLPTDVTNKAKITMDIMRANFPDFLSGVTYDSNSSNFLPMGSVTITTLGSNSDRIFITNNNQTLKMDTIATTITNVTPNLQIVSVSAEATALHDTYFLRLAGISNITLGGSATAERVPTVIVLVLDVSGSMRGNNGWSYLPTAVTNFVNNFTNTQSQDFLAVVTFSSYATVMWPTNYLGSYSNYQSQMLPANNFVTPVRQFMTNTPASGGTNALISQGIRFNGVTCAQEGMRLGYQVMNNLLGGITDAQLRTKLRTYYVIFTDGEFNTTRTYVKGSGFGIDTNGSNFYHSTSNLPFFHYDLPVMCNNNDFSQYTNVIVYGNTNMTASNIYDLNATNRFGNYTGSSNITWSNFLNAVNCTLAGYQIHGEGWNHKKTNDMHLPSSIPIYWTNQTNLNNSLPIFGNYSSSLGDQLRTNRYWTNNTTTSYIITNCMNHALWANNTNTSDDGRGWTSWNNKLFTNVNILNTNTAAANVTACFSTNAYGTNAAQIAQARTNMYWLALYEVFKATPDPAIIVPTPILFDEQNPTKQTWYPTNAADYNMNTRTLSAYPSGRTFANIYGFSFQRAGTSSRAPSTLPDSTTNGDTYYSARMSDFYPEFRYGAPITHVLNFTNSTNYNYLNYPKDVMQMITNTNDGIRYQMYSFKEGTWKDFSYNTSTYKLPSAGWQSTNTDAILNEGNWLTMMQAWIARKEQNAQIYFVNFSNNGNLTEKRQIANDRTGNNGVSISPFFSDQPVGGFYNTTNQATLTDAFDDIARKINSRLTK